jgi:hypothetical protein
VLDELDASGQSVAAFARQRGLHPARVRRWRSELRDEPRPAGLRLVELVARREAYQGGLRVHCPSGHVVEVGVVDLVTGLRAVLTAVAEVTGC